MKKIKPAKIASAIIVVLIIITAVFLFFEIRSRMSGTSVQNQTAAGQGNNPGGQGGQAQLNPQSSTAAGAAPARTLQTVRVTPVVLGTIENSVVINGDVLASTQVSIFPTVAGRIAQTRFQVGDSVSRGTVMATVDPSRPGEIFSHSSVLSTISGTVLQSPVSPGDTVSVNTTIYVVGDLSSLVIETFVPERFSNAARRGLPAQVVLEALHGETFEAVVDEVSPVLDPSSRTLRIRLRFSGTTDSRIKAGMFATITLVTSTRQNVPVIPRASMINTYGSWIVFVVDENNTAIRREITLGLESETLVEVLDGLVPGDLVVSAGQNFLSSGEQVRIVE